MKNDNPLRLRLSDDMYNHLIKMSEKHKKSISSYIRDLITKDIREMSKEK